MKKKNLVTFSIFNLTKATNEKVIALQNTADGFFAIMIAAAIINENSTYALVVSMTGFLVSKLIGCLDITEE